MLAYSAMIYCAAKLETNNNLPAGTDGPDFVLNPFDCTVHFKMKLMVVYVILTFLFNLGSSFRASKLCPNVKTVLRMGSTDDSSALVTSTLKARLFGLCAACDRGFFATQSERDEIARVVEELCALNPTEDCTKGLTPDDDTGSSECPLAGKWRMVYTNAADVLLIGANPLSAVQAIYQEINRDGESSNIIDFIPRIESVLPFSSILRLRVKTKSRRRTDKRVGLQFVGGSIEPQSILNFDVSNILPKLGGSFPRLTLFGGENDSAEGPGYFDVKYLDDSTLIISQNEPGGYFVSIREDDEDW